MTLSTSTRGFRARHFSVCQIERLADIVFRRVFMEEPKKKPSGRQEDRPNLSVLNTIMASDRTLMAGIRTALSMMTFGFTLYKVLQALPEGVQQLPRGMTPRTAGLLLIAVGLVAVTLGAWQYWQTRRQLHQLQKFTPLQSPTWIMALVTIFGGTALFGIILSRML